MDLDENSNFRVAKFGVVEPNVPHRHHDALEFPDGNNVLVTLLVEGQRSTVLQLPVVHQISGAPQKLRSTEAHRSSSFGRRQVLRSPGHAFWRQRHEAGGVSGHFLQAGTAGSP